METSTVLVNYGKPVTYFGIAYTLTKDDNCQLAPIDETIQKRLGDSIFFAPDGSRHITIMNLTSVVDGFMDHETVDFFEKNLAHYRNNLKHIAHNQAPFTISLNTLTVGSQAIILQGQDRGQITNIRDELRQLPRLGGQLIDSGFIHSTQARYKAAVNVGKVREQLSDIPLDIPITIDKIGLVRTDANFSKSHTVFEEFVLKP